MSAHSPNNSQCDLNMYGPDPGDGSVKCTCDEDAPIEPAVGTARPVVMPPRMPQQMAQFAEVAGRVYGTPAPVGGDVVLTGRAASTHAELQAAGREYRAAQAAHARAEQRFKAALDAHMQELA